MIEPDSLGTILERPMFMSMWAGHRVETVPAPWMTAAESPNREPASVTYPVQLKRFDGV